MTNTKKTLSIFRYSDYRLFLKDYYSAHKKMYPEFTYRYIAEQVGFKSAGHFTQILNGSINLSDALSSNFAAFLKFGKKEAEYFELLVRFNQAKTHAEKRRLFERMLKYKELKVSVINADQYSYFDKWYYVAIREVLAYYPFNGDYAELAGKVKPAISPKEAQSAIELLLRLGLITLNADGIYEKTASAVSANPVGKSVAINNQALETMRLAAEALDRFPREVRNISGVAFSISQKSYDAIQEEVRSFRKKILNIAQADPTPDGVYQFNVQLFPLTNIVEKKTEGESLCD